MGSSFVRVPFGIARMLFLCLLAGILLAGTMAPIALGVGSLANQVSDSVDSISASMVSTQVPLVTTVEDKNGTAIAQLFDQYRLPVSFQQISPNMVAALVDIEDHRFYQESGVDLQSMIRALVNNSSGGSTQGGSTISQQFVKNYLVDVVDRGTSPQAKAAQAADTDQSLVRKLREAKIAVQLNQTMTKNQIVTGYLNVVPFGSKAAGPFGVGAAAKAYFHELPSQLTVAQSALLAGMVNNPVLYNPYTHPQQALARRDLVIDDMVKYGSLSATDGAKDKKDPLGVVPNGPDIPSSTCYDIQPDAGFFCSYVVRYLEDAGFTQDQINSGGYVIKTTMDPTVSTDAKTAVDNWVPTGQDGVANTLAVVQPGTSQHNVLAMVANRNYGLDIGKGETATNLVANVDDEFGGGSTFKLFTTASALEQGKAGLNTMLDNPNTETFQISARSQPYPVSNNDGTPPSLPLWQGLADSPNTAFVGLELNDGMSNVLTMAYRLGMRDTMLSNQHGGTPVTDPNDSRSKSALWSEPQLQSFRLSPSFTLGVSPLSPLEHSNVGATLASNGVWCPPNPIQSVTDRYGNAVPVLQQPCEQVISPAEANTIRNGMSHNLDPGATGHDAAVANNWTIPLSAKTGTTQNNESVGYLAIVDGYAASSLVFADSSRPDKICASQPPRLDRDGACGSFAFGASVSAPPFYQAFEQILAGVPNAPIPDADPNFLDAQDHGPIVPFVMNQQADQAVGTLKGSGYQVAVRNLSSSQPKGTVVGQTPQSNQPAGTVITLYVSTGALPTQHTAPAPIGTAPGSGTGG